MTSATETLAVYAKVRNVFERMLMTMNADAARPAKYPEMQVRKHGRADGVALALDELSKLEDVAFRSMTRELAV